VSSGSRDRIASDVCVSEARRSSCPGEARTDAAARNRYRRIGDRQPREARRDNTNAPTSTVSTARCGPACRVVWEGSGHHDRPLSRFLWTFCISWTDYPRLFMHAPFSKYIIIEIILDSSEI
jgi:hypothetical protein